jgi:hypothetical protein
MERNVMVPLVNVHVWRDTDSVIPVTVPAHEVEVLRAIHGGDNVTELGPDDDEVELPADAETELRRLRLKYKPAADEPDAVQMVYRGPRELERFGFKPLGGEREIPQAYVVDHRKAAKAEGRSKAAKQ